MKFIMISISAMCGIRLLTFIFKITEYSLRVLIVIKIYFKICYCQNLTNTDMDLFFFMYKFKMNSHR